MLIGGKVDATRYVSTWYGDIFEVTFHVIKSTGKRFYLHKERALINAFSG